MIIIDRIIDAVAVCEADGSVIEIPLSAINGDACEGDVLCPDENGKRYTINADETQKRRTMLAERFTRITNRHKK